MGPLGVEMVMSKTETVVTYWLHVVFEQNHARLAQVPASMRHLKFSSDPEWELASRRSHAPEPILNAVVTCND